MLMVNNFEQKNEWVTLFDLIYFWTNETEIQKGWRTYLFSQVSKNGV